LAGEPTELASPAFDVFFAARNQVTLYEDALPALRWLASRYPLVALTNGNADLDRIGLSGYFAACVTATGLGVGKPDVRAFTAAAAAAGVHRHQVLHVGDDVQLDVLGAMAAGMQAVWVNRTDQLWAHDTQVPHEEIDTLTELCNLLGQGA
jgi:FMN hydrolase / 5-amino-6-(5-phospho-D-ribitylamino)uracil phosphatase